MRSLLTGWCGTTFAKIAAHTMPLMESYARRHGHVFACVNLAGERAPSWMKIQAIHQALKDCDTVVWLDADVVVLDGSQWIGDELPDDKWHGLVEHVTECGDVPNCGVWILRRHMMPWLEIAWDMHRYIDHQWWEQAAVLELLGYQLGDGPTSKRGQPTHLRDRTQWLAAEWNDHPRDANRAARPRFVHVTQYDDRLATVKRYVSLAT